MPSAPPITEILGRLDTGDDQALDDLLPLVYEELRRIAHRQRKRDRKATPTLNTTALVHEVYLRFYQQNGGSYESRGHFFAVAAMAMRQVVIDQARKKLRKKRGSGELPVNLEDQNICIEDQAEFLVSLGLALDRLGDLNPSLRTVTECRFFAGMTESETAEALGVDPRTARRYWAKAKAWLTTEMDLLC